jgi:hypothetical protein
MARERVFDARWTVPLERNESSRSGQPEWLASTGWPVTIDEHMLEEREAHGSSGCRGRKAGFDV